AGVTDKLRKASSQRIDGWQTRFRLGLRSGIDSEAGKGTTVAYSVTAHFAKPTEKTLETVESGQLVLETRFAHEVRREFGSEVRTQPEHQLFGIEREVVESPGTCLERVETIFPSSR